MTLQCFPTTLHVLILNIRVTQTLLLLICVTHAMQNDI